jgi:hypothetical protein
MALRRGGGKDLGSFLWLGLRPMVKLGVVWKSIASSPDAIFFPGDLKNLVYKIRIGLQFVESLTE